VRGLVALAALLLATACGDAPVAPERTAGPDVGAWATWVLPSGDAVRPPAPAVEGSAITRSEIEEIVRLQQARTAATDSLVRAWDGDPTSPWTRLAVERLDFHWPLLPDVRDATPARAARLMALLHVALHDAMVAVWEAKYRHGRRSPTRVDSRVRSLTIASNAPSYPSEHAAAAAAAAMILAYTLPLDDTLALARHAREAAETRIVAGAAYRSDVEAGWAIGRAVAQRVIDRARQDGAAQRWAGTIPTGATLWKPTPPRRVQAPFDPQAGAWKTWVIPAGNAFRLPPPPGSSTPRFVTDMAELRRLGEGERTMEQTSAARYWATDAPSLRWELFLDEELARRRWSVPHSARARAYVSIASYDAVVACWDTKYTYWLARPVTVDSSLKTVFSTPPFPSYPSGHSTMSTAAAVVMGELFPDAASQYHRKAEEASFSRVWGGVHYRFDVLEGDSLGARVGRAVVARLRAHDRAR